MQSIQRMLFLFVFYLTVFPINAQEYRWPTDASNYMTSSFCEFRPRHYHAAIDIKTWQKSGYKIFAVQDAYVYRLRISASGYGKAVYIKLRDGNIAVYAHLSGFSPALQAYADSIRIARQNNILDIFPDPGRFRVRRGDYLGNTGATGIGVPHLHFEIWYKGEVLNPENYILF